MQTFNMSFKKRFMIVTIAVLVYSGCGDSIIKSEKPSGNVDARNAGGTTLIFVTRQTFRHRRPSVKNLNRREKRSDSNRL